MPNYNLARRTVADSPYAAPAPPPPLISVLIVNFRAYDELTECLKAVAPYLGDGVEVIIVDHDSEPAAAHRLKVRFPWVHLVEARLNPGFAAGVNRAFAESRGRYVLLLNPDCIVGGDVFRELAQWLEHHPRVAVAGALVRESDGSVQASARRFPGVSTSFAGRSSWLTRVWPQNPWSRRNLLMDGDGPREVDWVSGACMMIRRASFESAGGFDEGFFLYWEDADFCFRVRRQGWSVVYYPGVGVTHLTGRSSARAQRQSLIAFHRSAYRYFRKNSGAFGRVMAPLAYVGLHVRMALKLASLALKTRAGKDR
jgi:GT2 family glycosyltransferase